MPKNKKLALKLGIQTYQIFIKDDEVFIPSLSTIFLAVHCIMSVSVYEQHTAYKPRHLQNFYG